MSAFYSFEVSQLLRVEVSHVAEVCVYLVYVPVEDRVELRHVVAAQDLQYVKPAVSVETVWRQVYFALISVIASVSCSSRVLVTQSRAIVEKKTSAPCTWLIRMPFMVST